MLRATKQLDPYDNCTKYHYLLDGVVSKIEYPDGIDREYDYSPSWIVDPAQDPTAAWPSTDYSGIEIRYRDRATGNLFPSKTRYMVFHRRRDALGNLVANTTPYDGDLLYRTYYEEAEILPDLADPSDGTLYGAPVTGRQFVEYGYVAGTDLLARVGQGFAAGIHGPVTGAVIDTVVYTYAQWGGRSRVQTEAFPLEGIVYTFAYNVDANADADPAGQQPLTGGTRTDNLGGAYSWTLDQYQRLLTETYLPRTGPNITSRATDPDYPEAEPASVTTTYEYGPYDCTCGGKPIAIIDSANRRWEYDYDSTTGLMTEMREPNPDGSATFATTSWSWEPAEAGELYKRYRLASMTLPDGQTWSYSYVPEPRKDSSHGTKDKRIIVTSPPFMVHGDATAHVLTSWTEHDISDPQSEPQAKLVGQVVESLDGDGISRKFVYENTHGYLREVVTNEGGGDNELRVETYQDRWGNVTQATNNKGAAVELLVNATYDGRNRMTSTSSTVDGVLIQEVFSYDRWDNLSVRKKTNRRSDGAAPDDYGPNPRPEVARSWIHDEWHYVGKRVVCELLDRRPLDRNDAGSVADAVGARFMRRDYSWTPDGLLFQVINPNGAETRYTYDGYGAVYKVSQSSPGQQDVTFVRLFVNSAFEVTREVRGTGGLVLAKEIGRNGAGYVTQLVEPQASIPVDYPWASIPNATHQWDYDAAGRVQEQRLIDGVTLLRKTSITHDEIGRVKTLETFEGVNSTPTQTYTTTWQKETQVKKRVGPVGRFVEYDYDDLGRVTQRADSMPTNPNKVVYDYQSKSGFVEAVTRKNWDEVAGVEVDRLVRYVYDSLGRRKQILVGPTGSELSHSFAYYTAGGTESYTDPSGKVTNFLPDGLGRLVERFMRGADPSRDIWNGTEWHDWTGVDDRSEKHQIDGLEHVTKTIYDFAGRAVVLMEPGSSVEPTDAARHQPHARLMAYDSASRLVAVYAGDELSLGFERDGMGRIVQRSRIIPPAFNAAVSYMWGRDDIERNALGQIVQTRSYNGFDADGVGAEYVREHFTHDVFSRMQSEMYVYSALSNGVIVSSGFSGGDRFRSSLTVTNTAGDDLYVQYVPDAIGRMASVDWSVDGSSWVDLASYKHEGGAIRQRTTTQELGVAGGASPFTFDTAYSFDVYGRMTGIDQSFDSNAYFDFFYDDASNLVKEGYLKQGGGGRVGDRFAYDEHHRLLDAWIGSDGQHWAESDPSSGVGTVVKRLTYNLDAANNRDSVDESIGGGAPASTNYVIESASNRYSSVGSVGLTYDARGNTHFDGECYLVYDGLNRLTEVYKLVPTDGGSQAQGATSAAEGSSTTFAVSDFSAVEFARQQIVNRMVPRATTLLYEANDPEVQEDAKEELSPTVAQSTTTTSVGSTQSSVQLELVALYFYDPMNRRVTRWVKDDATYYYAYDGWQEVQKMTGGASPTITQSVWGDQLDELLAYRTKEGLDPWVNRYVAEGGAHCPVRVLGEAGAVVEVQEYDPYGRTLFWSGGGAYGESQVGNAFGWRVMPLDPETGLFYSRNRFYSPDLGRFVSRDPLGVGGDPATWFNAYNYGSASPLVQHDPLGLQVAMGGSNLIGFTAGAGGINVNFGSGDSFFVPNGTVEQDLGQMMSSFFRDLNYDMEWERWDAESRARDDVQSFSDQMTEWADQAQSPVGMFLTITGAYGTMMSQPKGSSKTQRTGGGKMVDGVKKVSTRLLQASRFRATHPRFKVSPGLIKKFRSRMKKCGRWIGGPAVAVKQDGRWVLLDGHHRVRAAGALGFRVPTEDHTRLFTDSQRASMLIEAMEAATSYDLPW